MKKELEKICEELAEKHASERRGYDFKIGDKYAAEQMVLDFKAGFEAAIELEQVKGFYKKANDIKHLVVDFDSGHKIKGKETSSQRKMRIFFEALEAWEEK